MKKVLCYAVLLACVLTVTLFGCHATGYSNLVGERYADSENYRTGAFTYRADSIRAVEVYWRSGAIKLIESDDAELSVRESGEELSEDAVMRYFLADGVLKIRFCASGASIRVKSTDKNLRLELPKGIDLSVSSTSAPIKADTLEQNDVRISSTSGSMQCGTIVAELVELSSTSGTIRADNVSARTLTCSATSGAVRFGAVSVQTLDCSTSSGSVIADGVTADSIGVNTSSGRVELSLLGVSEARIHTSSGKVDCVLPTGGAEVYYTSSSGRLKTDRDYESKGGGYIFGDGESKITVETSSGSLHIQ